MQYNCPECETDTPESGIETWQDRIVVHFQCVCGCEFDVTYWSPEVTVFTHGKLVTPQELDVDAYRDQVLDENDGGE
jgi:hypothetical protein